MSVPPSLEPTTGKGGGLPGRSSGVSVVELSAGGGEPRRLTELKQIVAYAGSQGATPQMTLSRELQELRDRGVVEFVDDRGTYRLIA